MASYSFVSTWRIAAPIADVWRSIREIDAWPAWWPSVKQVERIAAGDAEGIGARWRFVYRGRLPYNLAFEVEVTGVEPPSFTEALSHGELEGVGVWRLSESEGVTTVRYDWDVRTTKWWMNLLSPILRPVFSWNHNVSMQECSRGMAKHLDAVLIVPAGHSRAPLPS